MTWPDLVDNQVLQYPFGIFEWFGALSNSKSFTHIKQKPRVVREAETLKSTKVVGSQT
jgi:hypothetical protein